MELTVSERLMLLDLLPDKSNYATWGVIDNAVKVLNLTEEEVKKADVTSSEDDKTKLNIQNNFSAQIDLSDWVMNHFESKVRELDRNYDLLQQHRSLYKKFVLDKEA